MKQLKRIITPYRIWMMGLMSLIGIGALSGLLVMIEGLSLTNLSDLVPWGLWITIDLSSIALAAGAFSLCAAVYILGLKKFEPVAKTATYIGIIGYSMAMLCLLLDIGRPDRFWHAFVYWNPHSVLWEVTMCVGLYFSVLLLEMLPIIGNTPWMKALFPWLSARLVKVHHIAPFLAVAGLTFSMLHQSSLGATYGVLKARPIWYRPGLSYLFIISAVLAGLSMTLLASMLAGRFSRRARVNDRLIKSLAVFVGWGLLLYLYLRFWDAFSMTYSHLPGRTEGFRMLTSGTLAFNFWVGEIILGILVPAILLLDKRTRAQPVIRMIAFAMVVGGLVAYRWDTNIVGQLVVMTYQPLDNVVRYISYFPSLVEILTGLGIIAFGVFAFTIGVEYLNIVNHRQVQAHQERTVQPVVAPAD
jgi:Ni/Fe-hydrogenase subunit HybB-like protein